jgi:hypothetical protein
MPIGIRGINPIWTEFDLTGNLFDDSFWMYVLQNTIPYMPTPVYHDVNLSQPWEDPIRFLANGTLPIDIFWDPTQVYRLEFRQNNGQVSPSQNDALIYEVDDYVPGTGGSTPVNTVAFPTGNQVTNPQFALFNEINPTTITAAGTYNIAPGWFLDLAGSGSATITQVPLTSINPTVSNAPYALHLVLSGWDPDSVILRQRFQQSGVLWSNMAVACAITAATGSGFSTLTANLIDNLGNTLANVLSAPVVNTTLTEYTGHGVLGASIDTTQPPAAYIELQIPLSSNADMYLTSIQLIVENPAMPFEPSFTQDSVNRQIDQTYNTAYPIVPVGTVIDFAGFVIPVHFFECNGATKDRIIYNQLYRALTTIETVALTSSNTFTVVSSANYRVGMAIEGNGIPASTTISNISGTTITISHAATITASSAITFFAVGNGNGSTTFTLPDLRDFVIAGLGGSLFSASHGNGVGGAGGAATVTLTGSNMPNTVGVCGDASGGNQAFTSGAGNNTFASTSSTFGQGGGVATSIVQQTALMKKCIRYE